jgi:hypothetical protein
LNILLTNDRLISGLSSNCIDGFVRYSPPELVVFLVKSSPSSLILERLPFRLEIGLEIRDLYLELTTYRMTVRPGIDGMFLNSAERIVLTIIFVEGFICWLFKIRINSGIS